MSTSEMDVPFGTCDWGGCDELAVARRRCPCCDDELPVCEQHAASALGVCRDGLGMTTSVLDPTPERVIDGSAP